MEAYNAPAYPGMSPNSNWAFTSPGQYHSSAAALELGGRSLPSHGEYPPAHSHDSSKNDLKHVGSDSSLPSLLAGRNSASNPTLGSGHADDDVFGFSESSEVHEEASYDAGDHVMDQMASIPSQPDPTAAPSRTLLVRNVASDANEEELLNIFKSFGDVRNLNVAHKQHQGVVTVSYYDLRAAVQAKTTLQGTLVSQQALEIHFSRHKSATQDPVALSQLEGIIVVYNLDPEATNEHLGWVFSKFGDVKDISQSSDRSSQKFVTFYDTRHAGAAFQAMNRAEHLGKLPPHITPQQAASMAFMTGSSPGLLQLAALQLQHENKSPLPHPSSSMMHGQWDHSRPMDNRMTYHQQQQQHGGPGAGHRHDMQPKLPSALLKMAALDADSPLHVSDSASSIASVANAAQLLAMSGSQAQQSLASMAAAAAGVGGSGSRGGGSPAGGLFHQGTPGGADRHAHAQQLLQQTGLSAAEAANMLMSLGLGSSADLTSQTGRGGGGSSSKAGGMYGAGPSNQASGPSSATVLAELMEMQARQQQQQQLAAAMQAQAQIQQALAVVGMGGNAGSHHHHMAAAQLLQQAAQLNLHGGQGGAAGGTYMPHLTSAAAVQLLQQAGFGGNMSPGYPGASQMGGGVSGGYRGAGSSAGGGPRPGDYAGQQHGGGGRGASDVARGGGGGRLSRRTTDPVAEAERKMQQEKLYAMDSERILSGLDRRTTLMIKNIPNKYTQKMLLATIDEHFHGTYDFFYLPIDFKNKCNVGYAFINMTQPVHIIPLAERFNLKKWERFNSEKICHISYARIQGRSSLISHFQNSSLMHEDKRCRPILFVLEGHEATGEQEPFPAPAGGVSGTGLAHLGGSRASLTASSSHPSLTACSSSASITGSAAGGAAR